MRNPVNVKAAKDKWAREIRLKAILALGGRCQGQGYCPEDDGDKLFIVLLNKESRKWSQQVAYRRIIDCIIDEDRGKMAKLLCRDCREMFRFNEKWVKANRIKNKGKTRKVWIAGELVDKPISYEDIPDHLLR